MFKRNAFFFGTLLGSVMAIAVHVAPAGAQSAGQPSIDSDAGILVENCMVRFINKTKVPSESQGKLTQLSVEEGMSIKKGDVIAIVDDQQARLALELKEAEELVAKLNAQNDVNKRDAVQSEVIARQEAAAYRDLYAKGAAPQFEMLKKQAEADRAILRIELADLNENTAMAEYVAKKVGTKLAQSDIEMRTIRAEFDAYVENRFAQLGEWVQPGSPIVELVQMDFVRVEGFIDAFRYAGQIQKGADVKVEITVGGTSTNPVIQTFVGKIDYVSMELDLNKRHRIWVKVPNQRDGDDWLIKPGMRATMQIMPPAAGGLF
ncbi:p-hydroxybenzoic acid efflux subunit AaeA [Stieleria maiorica]|uniref:p-hydroxybenzoic acid efflux subunit AaeA n=1 Tax=Stieleria maiorica TaxID=2795974 RepID=A0A5B9M6M0_9BACT|nr:HlyD family efflux transporter periplasmic adaptor subunit [Stieleria maiorica]QEF96313.1 p-hydroxybenzoic acid efflux subunit AaeA [Stieleria maiorica]